MRRTFALVTSVRCRSRHRLLCQKRWYVHAAQNGNARTDLAAIEKLHQEDIEATLSQDAKGLIDIWTED
jgi:hypothetical protein